MSYLMRRDPFRGMLRMQEEMDRLFQHFFGPTTVQTQRQGARVPAVDIAETADEVIVRAELPGINKENLELEVLPEMLSLKAHVTEVNEETNEQFHSRERSWVSFERDIPLPAEVKPDVCTAKLENGVLEVRLPKSERVKAPTPRKVTIA